MAWLIPAWLMLVPRSVSTRATYCPIRFFIIGILELVVDPLATERIAIEGRYLDVVQPENDPLGRRSWPSACR